MVVFGPLVREASASFDAYWNAAVAYRVRDLVPPPDPHGARALQQRLRDSAADPAAAPYLDALARTPLVTRLIEGRHDLEWLQARLVADPPSKLVDAPAQLHLAAQLAAAVGVPQTSFDVVSPYFVPGKGGTEHLVELARRGVAVRVLTKSLAATDVAAVHAGYAKRRHALLAAGVRLYELKPDAADASRERGGTVGGGSSDASLHAKSFAVDGEQVFVGSFNLDPVVGRFSPHARS